MYRRLLAVGVVHLNKSGDGAADSVVAHELVDKNFAGWVDGGTGLVAVPPRLAIESALLALERGILRTHQACVNALTSMPALQEAYEKSPGGERDDERVRIIEEQEAGRLATTLLESARHEVLVFQVRPAPESPPWVTALTAYECATAGGANVAIADRLRQRGVRIRCIYAQGFLDCAQAREAMDRHTRQGLEMRAIHTLPTTMLLVDARAALLPLDTEAATGAVMFRHGAALDLLRAAFELHWGRSVPLVNGVGIRAGGPSDIQMRIIRLLAAGLKDDAVARHLHVSLRTVRRNLTALCDAVGVPTRFALATVAAERRWISGSTGVNTPLESRQRRSA
jgi:DNA-binding CsgD family transcriptional regulator